MDLLTFNEYVANAKMAKEQKHKFNTQNIRSLSKKKLFAFMRPMTSQQTPFAKEKIECRAEFNIKNLLKCKKKHSKVKNHCDDLKATPSKRKNFNYKTPPPELAHVVPLGKR